MSNNYKPYLTRLILNICSAKMNQIFEYDGGKIFWTFFNLSSSSFILQYDKMELPSLILERNNWKCDTVIDSHSNATKSTKLLCYWLNWSSSVEVISMRQAKNVLFNLIRNQKRLRCLNTSQQECMNARLRCKTILWYRYRKFF